MERSQNRALAGNHLREPEPMVIQSFILFAQPQAALADAWNAIVSLLQSGAIKPIVAKTFPLAQAAEALHYLVENRPFGRVVLTI
jgi:NADPH2:quinone reductase